MRQLLDESDGIAQQYLLVLRQIHLSRGGIQRREQLVFREDAFAGERVK